jgi:hypothetical protein
MPMSLSRGAIVMLPSIARNQPGVPDERGHLALKQYGDKAIEQSAARADELAAQDDYNGQASRVTEAVSQT